MASSHFNLFFPIVTISVALLFLFPITISATEFVVGDSTGWTGAGYNYTAWAQGKLFHVGDTLVFNYPQDRHNVFKVNNSDAFANCTIPLQQAPLNSGKDVITLAAAGKKWYICGVANHCIAFKQKLVINVEDAGKSSAPVVRFSSAAHLPLLAMAVLLVLVLL